MILVFNSAASRDEKMKGGKNFNSRTDNKASQKKHERTNNGNALRLTRKRERKQEETCKTSFVDYGLEQRKKKNINWRKLKLNILSWLSVWLFAGLKQSVLSAAPSAPHPALMMMIMMSLQRTFCWCKRRTSLNFASDVLKQCFRSASHQGIAFFFRR